MSLFDSASLVVTPNGVKEGKLYSIKPTDGSGDLSVTRATTATRVNSAGLVELVPYNLLGYSEKFDNAYWNKNDCSVSANAIAAPNGTLTADKLVENSSNTLHYLNSPGDTVLTGTNTLSVYAKAAGRNWIWLYLFDGVLGSLVAYFNISNGTLGTVPSGLTANIESVGNGWYRCSITRTQANSGNGGYGLASADNTISYAGNGTSGAYIWGGQLVQGSVAKDYLRTETRLNIPRLDYTNVSCPSILVEPQRTNLATYSDQFNNASYNYQNASVTANTSISPDGTTNADSMLAAAGNTYHRFYKTISATAGSNTFSAYVKAGTATRCAFGIAVSGGYSNNNVVEFDLSNGTISRNPYSISATITAAGNGWYRITHTHTSAGGDLCLHISSSTATLSNFQSTFNAAGTETILMYGMQFEVGSYATSYIPTVASSVTRNADVISKTGISSLIGQTEGTIFFDAIINTNNESADIITLFNQSNVLLGAYVLGYNLNGNITLFSFPSNNLVVVKSGDNRNTRIKLAFSYSNNDFTVYINGIQTYTSSTLLLANNLSTLYINSNAIPSNFGIGNYNTVALWKTRLDNATLATLTTI